MSTSRKIALATGIAGIILIIRSRAVQNRRKALIERFNSLAQSSGETSIEPIIEKMTDNEISTVYDVVIAKKPLTPTLRAKFLTLSEKYNIFT